MFTIQGLVPLFQVFSVILFGAVFFFYISLWPSTHILILACIKEMIIQQKKENNILSFIHPRVILLPNFVCYFSFYETQNKLFRRKFQLFFKLKY